MGSAILVFWCRTARSRRSGHQCSLCVILRELCVTAPCMGEAVSVLADGLPPWGTGHFISSDIFAPSFSLPGSPIPRLGRAGDTGRQILLLDRKSTRLNSSHLGIS